MRASRKRRAKAALAGLAVGLAGCAKLLSLDGLSVEKDGAGGTGGADAGGSSAAAGQGGAAGSDVGGTSGGGGATGGAGGSSGSGGAKAGAGGTGGSAGGSGTAGQSGAGGQGGMAGAGGNGGASGDAGTAGSAGVGGSIDGGVDDAGDAGDAGDDAAAGSGGMTTTSIRPPLRPDGPPTPTGGLSPRAFIVRKLFFGSVDPATEMPDSTAWTKLGYDVDGKCTTLADSQSAMPGTCIRPMNAATDTLVDGLQCRDNNFGSELIRFVAQLDVNAESKINASVEKGGSTLMLVIDDLDDGPDDTYAPARLYLAAPVELEGGTFKWDGTDVRNVDAHSLAGDGTDLLNPKQSFLTGYMRGDTWVTGDFNKTPAQFTLSLSGQPVPIDADSFTMTIHFSPDHTQVLDAAISAAIVTQKLVASVTPAAYALAGCSKFGADIYLNAIPQWSDLASGAPDFLDTTKSCDTISLGAAATIVPLVLPTVIDHPPDPPPACPDGG